MYMYEEISHVKISSSPVRVKAMLSLKLSVIRLFSSSVGTI